jgi:hypothetical protein
MRRKSIEAKITENADTNTIDKLFLSTNNSPLPSEFIQSYLLSVSKHPFSDYEKRILSRLVECFQLKEEQHKDFFVKQNPNGDVEVVLSLKEGEDFIQIKKALDDLQKRTIHYEDEERWISLPFLYYREGDKKSNTVRIMVPQEVYKALVNLPSNYQKQELEAVISFRSTYAMRFYELLKGQNGSIHYDIEKMRTLMGVGDKYRMMNNFLTRVVEQARKEMDKKGTFSFTYRLEYEKKQTNPKGGKRKAIGIIITPVYHPEQMDNIPPMQETKQQLSESNEQDSVRTVLKSMFGFSGNDLVRLTDAVLRNGGHSYLTQLLQSCKGNIEKIKEKLKQLS